MLKKLAGMIKNAETVSDIGKIENVVGMAIEASGSRASIGDIAMIYDEDKNRQIPVEIVGFKDVYKRQAQEYKKERKICQIVSG